ncbi:hypothetical protein MHO82_14635 [Vibrio sp. Of7-15]|uniref:hypothetical protein n=1 Tax=Vibrio sp. Of7-15 TaxID=2724879 RepID=UPI001EF238FA|nr:hypothetical protein [Vibrio sp. Of7-15]MCG7498104.1 hypothetical protein [Vibrio sp. Of7-15]
MNKRIHTAYQGEQYGIAFFNHFLKLYKNEHKPTLWQTLIKVETLTAQLLEEHLIRNQLLFKSHDPEMERKGQNEAEQWLTLPWDKLTITLANWVEPYEKKYRAWVDEASAHKDIFRLIADHETAIYHCWQRERKGVNGLLPLEHFLERYSEKK